MNVRILKWLFDIKGAVDEIDGCFENISKHIPALKEEIEKIIKDN